MQGNPVKINENLIGLSYGQGNPVKINKNLIGLSYGQGNPVKINENLIKLLLMITKTHTLTRVLIDLVNIQNEVWASKT